LQGVTGEVHALERLETILFEVFQIVVDRHKGLVPAVLEAVVLSLP